MAEAPLSSQGSESGVVVEFVPSAAQPVIPNDVRVVGLIGEGKTTKSVFGTTLTRSGSPDTADTLTPAASILPDIITDENLTSYSLSVDYVLTSGNVDWSPTGAATFTSTVDASSGLTLIGFEFKVTVDGGSEQSITFTDPGGGDPLSQGEIVTQLSALTGVSVATAGSFIKIDTTAVNNATLLIGDGSANAILGYTGGLEAIGPKEPASGVDYTIDYETVKTTDDFKPKLFTSLDALQAEYGDPSTSNTLSVGAELVFENSASSGAIQAVQIDPAEAPDLLGFRRALNRLAAIERVNIVVALTGDSNLYADIKSHVVNSSAPLEKKLRTAIIGLDTSVTTISGATTLASGLAAGGDGRRIILVHPPTVKRFIGSTETTLDGSFLAASIAGLRINRNFDVAEPLLRKQLVGFTEVQQDALLRTDKLLLRNGGVTVIETQDGIVRITEDTTVDRTTSDSRSYPVTEIIDFVADTTRRLLDSIFIGIKGLPDTPNLVIATMNVILSTIVDLKIINEFGAPAASFNPTDPEQIDVSFTIQPTRTVRFIKVTFSI